MNSVGKSRNVDHAIRSGGVADSDLADAGTDRRHRFPVAGLATPLNLVELVAGLAACILGEIAQAIERVP